VKIGEAGELWQAGPHMMRGYFRKPEANAEAFRDSWFRTGDIARMDERGFTWIVGRTKDMVRRSGENVAAREVEAVALMLPEIEEAAVVAVPDPERGEEVKIFLQLKPGATRETLPPERVLAHCRANLAPFKVPRFLAYIAEIPRTASNKIEKGALRGLAADPIAGCYDAVTKSWR
jgi:acyl-CoA synthetase (AMP-forming)/AMP-acid ligase II